MNLKKIVSLITVLLATQFVAAAEYKVSSPNGKIEATISVTDKVTWSIAHDNKKIIKPSRISMQTSAGELGIKTGTPSVSRNQVNEILKPVVPEKRRLITNHYNELVLTFKTGYRLEFRIFDDGAAYRFVTSFDGDMIVKDELVEFNFAADHHIYFPKEQNLRTGQERNYEYRLMSEIKDDEFCSVPVLVDIKDGPKVAITESDLYDYSGFFLRGSSDSIVRGMFSNVVTKESMIRDRISKIEERADYIAKTKGNRSFPWRIVAIAEKDADLINCQIVWKLARPCQIEDTSWIKPGKVAWDWYNASNLYGVDFRAGLNTETYKYYIDFASEHNIEYIVLDEGWYKLGDLLDLNPEMNVPELFRYAKKKNVGIILWVVWKTLEDQLDEALDAFEKWGCKGIKVDFMERDDQWMVNYFEKIAREAAKRKLLVDFHGCHKPAGQRRAYPNIITREGVKGAEHQKWSDTITPEHNVTIPFIRMLAGPIDYTPGAMVNAQKKNFKSIFDRPMSQGTRCHQLAMYVVFESPLQMLCDSPSNYIRQPECMEFLGPVPTVWDETIVLDAKVGEYVLIARQSGKEWYIGAMTNWDARTLTVDLSFLTKKKYTAHIWKDGINADRYASDFKAYKKKVSQSDKLEIKLAPGGGWAARLTPR